jgi:uncharacterized hydrophobic protein (TIGR00341 family)
MVVTAEGILEDPGEDEADRVGPAKDVHGVTSEDLLRALPETTIIDLPLLLLTAISTIVALVGLFLNNVAIIIGAMVVSPLLSPITGFILELTVGRPIRAFAHLKTLLLLLLTIIVLSAVVTAVLFTQGPVVFTPQILARFERRDVYLVMAVLLGFAAMIAEVKGFHESLVGIGIAASLLPPAAVAGIAFALFQRSAFSALALALDNIIGVMIGGFLGVFFLKLGPGRKNLHFMARKKLFRTLGILFVLFVLLYLDLIFTG